jgi:hypothetical protein
MKAFVLLALVCANARADEALPVSPEAHALVDGWVAAQNRGDFAAYERLYAPEFSGVRRSGARTATFDRAGWMKDRKRMFQKPMTVEIADLRLASVGTQTIARFRQTWASGSYQDVGLKQLTMAGGKIVREEMFDSAKVAPGPARPLPFDQFAYVVDGAVVIDVAPEDAWARGKLRVVSKGNPLVVRRAAEPPRAKRGLAGKRMRLFSLEGPVCEATLADRYAIVAREADTDGPDEAFELGQKVLVAELSDPSGDCKGARFARSAALPAPAISGVTAGALPEAVLAAYRALPAWKDLQKTWRADPAAREHGAPREWDGGDKVRELWSLRAGTRTLVGVRSFTGFSCGEFGGGLWALFELDEKGTPTLRFDGTREETLELLKPHHAVDLDGDGEPELLFDGILSHGNYDLGVLKRNGSRYELRDGLEVSYHHCHC